MKGAIPNMMFGIFLLTLASALAVGAAMNLISGLQNKEGDAALSFLIAAGLGYLAWWLGWRKGRRYLNSDLHWRSIYLMSIPDSIRQLRDVRQTGGLEAVANHPFPEHWKEILFAHSRLYCRMPIELKTRLHQLTNQFLSKVQFNHGVLGEGKFGEENMVLIAGEACVLILGRDYQDFRKLELVNIRENTVLKVGLLPWNPDVIILGQASPSTVMLHWETAMTNSVDGDDGDNLILHEFAHIMDYAEDGTAQSILGETGSKEAGQWETLLEEEFPKLVEAHNRGEDHVLPPYAVTLNPSHVSIRGIEAQRPEFFSCATEAFFERSDRLQEECPEIYRALRSFYQLDPAKWEQSP